MAMTPLEVKVLQCIIAGLASFFLLIRAAIWGIDRANRNLELENMMYEVEAHKPRRIK